MFITGGTREEYGVRKAAIRHQDFSTSIKICKALNLNMEIIYNVNTHQHGGEINMTPLSESKRVERLVGLCRLWGAVKYFHPYLAYRGDIDWDAVLVAQFQRSVLRTMPVITRLQYRVCWWCWAIRSRRWSSKKSRILLFLRFIVHTRANQPAN